MLEPEIEKILTDPTVHNFAKHILNVSLSHDPVDALDDVELAARVLKKRLDRILNDHLDCSISNPGTSCEPPTQ